MAVDRRESMGTRVVRISVIIIAALIALSLLGDTWQKWRAPSSPIWRYRSSPSSPHVFVRGALKKHSSTQKYPPLCTVHHQRLTKCGKSSCWVTEGGMNTATALIDVAWSSSPLPSEQMEVEYKWVIEPLYPNTVEVDPGDRRDTWIKMANEAKLPGFDAKTIALPNHRVIEGCLDEGMTVFIDACIVSTSPPRLSACPATDRFSIAPGDTPQAAIDDVADQILARVAGGFLILAIIPLVARRKEGMLVDALARRATGQPPAPKLPKGWVATRKLGALRGWWSLLLAPAVAGIVNFIGCHSKHWPNTYSTGRGGMVLAVCAITVWLLLAISLLLQRRKIAQALAPILTTARTPLASANGTVELSVRARVARATETANAPAHITPIIGSDSESEKIVFAEARIHETYRQGKNTSSVFRLTYRPREEIEVYDESSEGRLHLSSAILDIETRKISFAEIPPRLAENGVTLERHPNHVAYVVEERVVHDNEPLYVFGEVSDIALRPGQEHQAAGYRDVRGSPTLGTVTHSTVVDGQEQEEDGDTNVNVNGGAPPLLVFAGDERGLVESLEIEMKRAARLAYATAGMCGLFSAIALFLAYL